MSLASITLSARKDFCIQNNWPVSSLEDQDPHLRFLAHIARNAFTPLSMKDSYWRIRLFSYESIGYQEAAKNDSHWLIRLGAYRTLGYTEEAFSDIVSAIRKEAYTILGYRDSALSDIDPEIRRGAELFNMKRNVAC